MDRTGISTKVCLLLGAVALVTCDALADVRRLTGWPGWIRDRRGSLFANPPRTAADIPGIVTGAWSPSYIGKYDAYLSELKADEDLSPERDFQAHRRIAIIAGGPDYGTDGYCAAAAIGGRVPLAPNPGSALTTATIWLLSGLSEDQNAGYFISHEEVGPPRRLHSLFGGQTEVWANRGEGTWTVAGREIPKDGFYAKSPCHEEGIIVLDGSRRAFSRNEETFYVNARGGGVCDFGGIVTDGALRLDHRDRWVWMATPLPGSGEFSARIDPRAFGRKDPVLTVAFAGDGKPVEIRFPELRRIDLQPEIDRVSQGGGGRVTVGSGEWESAPIVLKSGVELHFEDGAILYASTNIAEYSEADGKRVFLFAENADGVSVTGRGVIDGRGSAFEEKRGLPGESQPQSLPVLLRFSRCTNVRLEDFTYRQSGAWGCHLRNCDGVTVRRVTCFNHINETNDGIDIESRNVLVEDCDIDADDDALCIKTESDVDFAVTNVVVRNCRLASSCNALRAGSGSYCDVRDVVMEDCTVTAPKGSWRFRWCDFRPGVTNRFNGMGVISFCVVDGGRLDGLTVRNISFEGCDSPIFFRLAARRPNRDGKPTYLRNVLIENVKGTVDGTTACSITGIPGMRIENFVLRNVDITFPGGEKANPLPIPEYEKAFPSQHMYGSNPLPAYGFYLRHADNIRFENVRIRTAVPDGRPPYVIDDCFGIVGIEKIGE